MAYTSCSSEMDGLLMSLRYVCGPRLPARYVFARLEPEQAEHLCIRKCARILDTDGYLTYPGYEAIIFPINAQHGTDVLHAHRQCVRRSIHGAALKYRIIHRFIGGSVSFPNLSSISALIVASCTLLTKLPFVGPLFEA